MLNCRPNLKSVSLVLVILSITFIFSGGQILAQTNSASPGIILTPDKTSLLKDQLLKLAVNLETGAGNEVNVFTVNLNYPQDKLTFVSIDAAKAPFGMEVVSKGGNGKVEMTRGGVKPQTGNIPLGTVTFKAKSPTDAGVVTVASDSVIVRSSDNINILPGSTVQSKPVSSINPSENEVQPPADTDDKPTGISAFFSAIINFFTSLFK